MRLSCSFIRPLVRSSIVAIFVRCFWLGACVIALAAPLAMEAAVLSWSGGAASNGNWSDPANWGFAGMPSTGDTLIFSGGQPRLANTNDIVTPLRLNQIRFAGPSGGYTIFGNAFTLTNSIEATNTAGLNTINQALAFSNSVFSVNVGSGASLLLAGALSGSAAITKNGNGTLTYAGTNDNTYIGTTTVNAGLLQLSKTNGFGLAIPHALVIGAGATVRCLSSFQIWSFGVLTTINQGALLDLAGNTDAIGQLTITGGQITTGAGVLELQQNIIVGSNNAAISTINGSLLLVTSSITISNSAHLFSPDLRINAAISSSGNFGLIKDGNGEVSLNTSNSFFGPVTVNNGSLWAENSNALGNVTNTATVNDGGSLYLSAVTIGTKPLTLNGDGWLGIGALSASGACSWSGNIALASDTTINVWTTPDSLDLAGVISGPGGITKTGTGTLQFSGSANNLYSGSTVVNQGVLRLNKTVGWAISAGALIIGDGLGGAGADVVRYTGASASQINTPVPITVTPSGLLDLNNHSDDVGVINFAGGDVSTGTGTLQATADFNVLATNRTANLSGKVLFSSGLRRINVTDGSPFYDIIITASLADGGAGLIISNSNPLGNFVILRGSNSFTGPLTIDKTFVSAETPWALGGTNGSTTVKTNSTLWMYITGITNEPLTLEAGASFVAQNNCTWTGPITLTGNATIQGFGGSGSFDLWGPISGTGNLTLFTDGGSLRMIGTAGNSYSGSTLFTAGNLDLNRTNFDGAIPHDFTINGATRLLSNNQIYNGANVSIGAAGSLTLSNNVVERVGTLSGSGPVSIGPSPNFFVVGDSSNNGSSTYNGTISGTGDLWKDAAGTFTLTGSNTYSGTTFIFAGTLVVNGYQPASPVNISTVAGTLAGSGTVGQIFCGGNLRPGTSPGILTCSNLTFTSFGHLYLDLDGRVPGLNYDQLNVRGTNSLSNAVLSISAPLSNPVSVGDQLIFINNDGADAVNGTFLSYGPGASFQFNGFTLVITYTAGAGNNDVAFTVTEVPGDSAGATVSSGNGNHSIDPNECNNISVIISNRTGFAMTGISAVLSTTNIGALVTQPYSAYPNVPANGKGTNMTSFQVSTLPTFQCGSDLSLRLTVFTASHGAFTVPVVLDSGLPSLVPTRYDVNVSTNIPDIGTIESTNAVAGFTGPLTKVAVSMWLTHTVDQDLSMTLIAPDGSSVDLSSGNGSGPNYGSACSPDTSRTTFDDSGPLPITARNPPFVGVFRPEVGLSNLIASPANGNWRLRINDSFGGSLGTLSCWSLFLYGVACGPGNGPCGFCSPSITGSITTNDPVQIGRLIRNGTPSSCGQPKSCPNLNDSSSRHFDLYTFTNTSGVDACVTVSLTNSCSPNLFAAAYLTSYDPTNLCFNYLGDAGASNPQSTFSITVPAGGVYVVAVHEITPNLGCSNYVLTLSGLPCPPPLLNIQEVQADKARLYWTNSAGGYRLESTPALLPTNWAATLDEPLSANGQYNVTNDINGQSKFYRLHKP